METSTALNRFAYVAAAAGTMVAEAQSRAMPTWRRFEDFETGLSFEVPFALESEATEGPFGLLVEGSMTLPYVLDVTYMASKEVSDATPKSLTHAMATQWMVDYTILAGPSMRRVEIPGVDEAWVLSAEIEDEAATIGYSWVTLSKGGRIGCLSVSCWAAEARGRAARERILESILGS